MSVPTEFVAEVLDACPANQTVRVSGPAGVELAFLASNIADAATSIPASCPAAGQPVICRRIGTVLYVMGYPNVRLPNNLTHHLPQATVAGSGVGEEDEIYRTLKENERYRFLRPSAFAAYDLLPGEEGTLSPLGVGWLRGVLFASLRASPVVDVSVHADEQLTRVWGFNLDVLTSCSASRTRALGPTVFRYEGRAMHVGETTGALGVDPFVDRESKTIDDPKLAGDTMPVEGELQQQLFSDETLAGTELQGELRQMSVVLQDAKLPAKAEDMKTRVGLLSERRGADGEFAVRSASGITLMKTPIIPLLIPQKDVGHMEVKSSASQPKAYQAPADLDPLTWGRDRALYQLGVQEVGALLKQEENWKQQNPSDVAEALDTESVEKLEVTEATEEAVLKVWKAGRKVELKVGKSHAYLSILADGSIVLEDGSGSALSMFNGDLTLTCPGNLICRPGKSFQILSPDDIIVKAGKNVELSSSEANVRVKAEREVQVLAGNGGQGGVLLESRASGEIFGYPGRTGDEVAGSGVIVKCPNSGFSVSAPNIGLNAAKLDRVAAGSIMLKTESQLYIEAKGTIENLQGGAHCTKFGDGKAVHIQHKDGLLLDGGTLFVDGPAVVMKQLAVGGTVLGMSYAWDGRRPLEAIPGADGEIKRQLKEANRSITETTDTVGSQIEQMESQLDASPYFSTSNIKETGFSFRTDEQYGEQPRMSASSWQMRIEGDTWEETAVVAPGGARTYPFPGYSWNTEAITTITPVAYDQKTGIINTEAEGTPETETKAYVVPKKEN